ncbi:MAG TPA: tripartite tricarboxylate transporter substrate binding protein [Xanthobacteraceae bacterium]|jgi:tripartite-type tricarboxylate transporter receptor subunit TctC|nr:tripartite tricarboxylate transporter substrate binding protein [Xanthobacteraceae bacterium]
MKAHTLLCVRLGLVAIFGVAAAGYATAQTYPDKRITIISPSTPGGPSDVALRPLAQELSKVLGQPVIVDNKPGAGGTLTGRACAQAAPDGYTLCNLFNDVISNAPFLFKNPGYDPYKDFVPIINGYFITSVIVASPELSVKTMPELVELSKKTPGGIDFATPSTGAKIFMDSFNMGTGANFRAIPYKSGSEVANALIANTSPVGFLAIGAMAPHIQAGKLKGLVVDSANRLPQFPDLATMKEHGYDSIRIKTWYGLFAPAGTPKPIVDRLYQEIAKIYNDPAFKEKVLINAGLEPAMGTQDEFVRFLQEDRVRTEALAKKLKLEPQ